jgi:hypothetical protein
VNTFTKLAKIIFFIEFYRYLELEPVMRCRSRWRGNILLEPEPKLLGLAPVINYFFIALYFKEPFDDHLCFKKPEIFLKACKFLNFFSKILYKGKMVGARGVAGGFDKLEPVLHTKMDWLRNTLKLTRIFYCCREALEEVFQVRAGHYKQVEGDSKLQAGSFIIPLIYYFLRAD